MLQLWLRLGTYSRYRIIFYNTVGGMIGGLMYYVVMGQEKKASVKLDEIVIYWEGGSSLRCSDKHTPLSW